MTSVWILAAAFASGAVCEALWGRRLRAAGERAADRLLRRGSHR